MKRLGLFAYLFIKYGVNMGLLFHTEETWNWKKGTFDSVRPEGYEQAISCLMEQKSKI